MSLPQSIRPHHSCRATRGLTLLEIVITLTIFTIGIGAVSSSLVASHSLNKATRESSLALEGAQSIVESLRGETFAEVFARFNATDADDPVGNSPGITFAVGGLQTQSTDADGATGQIVFPGDGTTLREDTVDAELGMPRDLNGDGVIDALDHSLDYIILPVRVRVQWTGPSGDRTLDLTTTLADI